MDDYIKREEAIRWNPASKDKRDYGTFNIDDAYETGYEDKIKQIEQIPAADVRENVYADCLKLNDDPYIMWKCGNCGWIRERTSKPKFCEECGAEFLPAVRGEKYV